MSQSVFVDMFGKLLHLSDIIVFSNNYLLMLNIEAIRFYVEDIVFNWIK